MTNINLLYVSVLGCHLQGVFQIKVIQAQHANNSYKGDAIPKLACLACITLI
jgi:hypothetical protein